MTSRKFFSLFLLCALVPLLAAKVSLAMGWFSATPVNKGQWLEREIQLLQGAPNANWRLVYLPAAECAADCTQVLHTLQQLYTGLGRKQINIQPMVMSVTNPAPLSLFPAIQWQSSLSPPAELNDQIVIVNREGMALLHYAVNTDGDQLQNLAKDIRSDLLRLMNYDRSGT